MSRCHRGREGKEIRTAERHGPLSRLSISFWLFPFFYSPKTPISLRKSMYTKTLAKRCSIMPLKVKKEKKKSFTYSSKSKTDLRIRLQRLHLRLRPNGSGQVFYDDGQTGRRPGRYHTTTVYGSIQPNQQRHQRRHAVFSGGLFHLIMAAKFYF